MIRKFREEDAGQVSRLIKRTLYEVNAKDYEEKYLKDENIALTAEALIERAKNNSYYVCEEDGKIVGVGGIGTYLGRVDESYIMTVFVLPEYIGKGFGRKILEALEKDEYFLRAKRVEVASSITALNFYRRLGYEFKDGNDKLNEVEQNYRLEKFNVK